MEIRRRIERERELTRGSFLGASRDPGPNLLSSAGMSVLGALRDPGPNAGLSFGPSQDGSGSLSLPPPPALSSRPAYPLLGASSLHMRSAVKMFDASRIASPAHPAHASRLALEASRHWGSPVVRLFAGRAPLSEPEWVEDESLLGVPVGNTGTWPSGEGGGEGGAPPIRETPMRGKGVQI